MMLESCSWFQQIQEKKNCPNQMDEVQDISNPVGVGVHVDISTQRQEGVNS